MIWGYSCLGIQDVSGFVVCGSLQVVLLGQRVKGQPGLDGQCVPGDQLVMFRFIWRD